MRDSRANLARRTPSASRRGAALGVLVTVAIVLVWAAVIVRCMWVVDKYEATAGKASNPPARWPADCGLKRSADRPTLVMLAHPHCPCTRATLGELAAMMRCCQSQVDGFVCFFRPNGANGDWEKSDLWNTASSIPGVTALWDDEGAAAKKFGAATSGAVVLYAADGRLLFSGGITRSRGMFGGNDGRETITALVHGETSRLTSTPVYGCQLLDSPERDKCCKPHQKEPPCQR